MSIWKNKVGRPSNEIVYKRRAIKTIVLACVVLVAIITTAFVQGLNSSKLGGAAAGSTATYEIAGVNGGIVADDKYYKAGKYLNFNSIVTGEVFAGDNGKRKVRVKVTPHLTGTFSIFAFTNLNSTTPVCSKNYSYNKTGRYPVFTCDITVTKKLKTIVLKTFRSGRDVLVNSIYVHMWPTVTNYPARFTKRADNTYKVSKNGVYYSNIYFKNPSTTLLYYRWFTYSGTTINKKNLVYVGDCTKFFGGEKVSKSLTVDNKDPKRIGMVKAYASFDLCEADKAGTNENSLGTPSDHSNIIRFYKK